MGMPTGDSPQTAQQYYLYLQGRELAPHGRTETWHVDWTSLAWLWGFVAVIIVVLLIWISEYRTHHPAEPISPADRWGGYATEGAGHVPWSVWLVMFSVVVFGVVLVVGHLVSGQLF
jgi:hypothetical protein